MAAGKDRTSFTGGQKHGRASKGITGIEALDAEITAAEDAIKAEMGDREALTAGAYKITWKPVTTARIDTAALKRTLPAIADRFTKQTTVRRFCIN